MADAGESARDDDPPARLGRVVGRAPATRRLIALLQRAAACDATTLLEGETGTGKEVSTHAIHEHSARRSGPFVVVDCGAIPEQLLESELFGYERGAFTGAVTARAGAFEAAQGGTIFLDELGELSLELQPKILRALESRQIKRVGSNTYLPVDVRVIAATNRDLREEVKQKRFRADLYYRLAVLHVRLPPLRERKEDLPLLVDDILTQLGVRDTPEAAALRDPAFVALLAQHRWPGNVRQLRNYLERRVALGDTGPLPTGDVSLFPGAPADDDPHGAEDRALSDALAQPLKLAREVWSLAFEQRYLKALLARHPESVSAAARAAGVNRVYLYRLLWKHGLRDQEPDDHGEEES